MTSQSRLGVFLRARRETLPPPPDVMAGPERRRTPGLRRQEVAMLAGVSTDYYIRLEQGRERHPSPQVLDALARVFQLGDEEVEHLHALVRPPRRRCSPGRRDKVSAGLVGLMQRWPDTPALVLDPLMNIRARNAMAAVLYEPLGEQDNLLRMVFLDPRAEQFYVDWQRSARNVVGTLRAAHSGSEEDDPRLSALVGELSVRSEAFARLWARHDVRGKAGDTKRLHHPQVGPLSLRYESFTVNGAPGQQLVVYHADPGSPSEDSLALLGSLVSGRQAPDRRGWRLRT